MIYISGPITKPNPMHNANTAVKVASLLMRSGYTPYVPHLSLMWDSISPENYDDWIAYDLRIINSCKALVRIPGESPGADMEVSHAQSRGIPIIELQSIPDFMPNECLVAVRDMFPREYRRR